MARVLVLFAHPALEKSRVHRRLIREVSESPSVTFHDLYEQYPDFNVNVAREQHLLEQHDLIVLQHPFFWYSTPALVKQWEDLVLEHGWAYGTRGTALRGKRMVSVITTGGQDSAYRPDGMAGRTVRDFLAPIEQSARLCGIDFWPPYLIQGTHQMTRADIEKAAARYRQLMELLRADRVELGDGASADTLNDVVDPLLDLGGGPR